MKNVLTTFLILAFVLTFNGCFWKMKNPSEVYRDGDIEKTLQVGLDWLEKYPDDNIARKITGKAALMTGDTTAAYNIWKPALLLYMDSDELVAKKTIEFGLLLGDLDFLAEIIRMRMDIESVEENQERLKEISALVKMKKNHALHSYLLVEDRIVTGEFEDAYLRIREINKIYPRTDYLAVESALQAYLLTREGTDEAVAKSMKLLEKILDDPAISIPVLYISSRIYFEIGRSQEAVKTVERAKLSPMMNETFSAALDQLFEDIHKKKNQYDR